MMFEEVSRIFSEKFGKRITRMHVTTAKQNAARIQNFSGLADQSAVILPGPSSTEVDLSEDTAVITEETVTVKTEPESCTVFEMN